MLGGQFAKQGAMFAVGLRDGDAGAQAADHGQRTESRVGRRIRAEIETGGQ